MFGLFPDTDKKKEELVALGLPEAAA